MITEDSLGPFQAGDGGLPPYLAGRESEQEICGAFLSRLRNGRPPPREIVFHGPRGNGKTALLAWFQKEVTASHAVDTIRLVPAAIRTETKLVERLLPSSWWQRLAPGETSIYGITWRPGEDRPPPLDEALAARSAKKPLVLLLDETHTLAPEVGSALLNASQQVGRKLPFLLVLAGTPELRSRLERYDELMERNLLPVARTVAEVFRERSRLSDADLDTAIVRGLGETDHPERVAAARTALAHLGYVWRPETEPTWEAGIPSLTDYMRRYAPAPIPDGGDRACRS